MERKPLMKNAPKSQEAACASLRPARAVTARITATGPDIEKANATTALIAFSAERSRTKSAGPASGRVIGSRGIEISSGLSSAGLLLFWSEPAFLMAPLGNAGMQVADFRLI